MNNKSSGFFYSFIYENTDNYIENSVIIIKFILFPCLQGVQSN